MKTVTDFIFLGSKSLQMVTTAMKLKDTCHLEGKKAKTVTNLDSVFKTKHYFSNKGVYLVKALVFPVVMYGCESWTINKAEHRRTASFELRYWRRLLSLLYCKEILHVNPKGNQSWIFSRRTDAEAEIPILWPLDIKNWLIGKDPVAGEDWRQEEKGTPEDEMVGSSHRLDGHGFEQTLGVGDGQGGLVCCSPRVHKEPDMTEWLKWTEKILKAMNEKLFGN